MKNNTVRRLFISLLCVAFVCPFIRAQEINTEVLYKIVSPSGLVIDNKGSVDDNARIYLSKDVKNSKGQMWKLTKLSGDHYIFTNPYSGDKSLDNGNIRD